jgi:hypothetical protein
MRNRITSRCWICSSHCPILSSSPVTLRRAKKSGWDELLEGWRSAQLQVMNQAGVRTEKLWFNFTPDRVHWPAYAGRNFTHR